MRWSARVDARVASAQDQVFVIGAQPTQNGETRRSALCQAGQTCCDGELMKVLFCKGVDVERMNVGEKKKRRSLSEVVAPADWSRLSNI